jgi:transposase
VYHDTGSALFGVPGLRVTDADPGQGGAVEIWAVTGWEGASACPDCGTESSRVHDVVVTCPKDVRRAGDPVELNWVKRRLKCVNEACGRRTFTERVPAVPPGCRVLPRLKEQCAGEVADRGLTPAEAARHAGVSRPVAQDAFTARAEEMLEPDPEPVAHLGIDEHRRGRPRWRKDEETGKYVQLADRWHVNFCDLSARQGMLGQVEGRTADDAAYWLLSAPPAWRDRVEVVAIDMCSVFASAVKRALPQALVAVDLFHVVQLAVKALGDVRRRATREKYGRRGKKGDPEYGLKGLLSRNLENLPADKFEKVIETLDADGHGQQVLLAWIAKEKLRDALNLRARISGSRPCERQVRDRLFAFYDWCAQNEAVPELVTLAGTVARWEDEIVTAVLTGVTNATSESLNRIAKLEARMAYGFRNPENQRRRVRIACTRGTRRRSPTATSNTKQSVINRKQVPG